MTKRILFITGTRADFSKLKALIDLIENSEFFECYIFATGMHLNKIFGYTIDEIYKSNYRKIYKYVNFSENANREIVLSNTIIGLSKYTEKINPDMIIVHGDRIEALAGAIVGALRGIRVAHIEGGEISGTIDEIVRHAITKISHVHFVSNESSKERLIQMGETIDSIYITGSPEIDYMKYKNLPSVNQSKKKYNIPFEKYSILLYHPDTTEQSIIENSIKNIVLSILKTDINYIIIYPNNDPGSQVIIDEYENLIGIDCIRIFPNIIFEHFLTLLKNADFIIGNSSVGVRVAGIYGIPSINIGERQKNRSQNKNIINTDCTSDGILKSVIIASNVNIGKSNDFGEGRCSEKIYEILNRAQLWESSLQKQFVTYSLFTHESKQSETR